MRMVRIWLDVKLCGDESRSRLPGVGVWDAVYSRHVAEIELFLELQKDFHQALTLLGGVRFIAWRLRLLFLANTDGDGGILGNVERVWTTVLRQDPPLKSPCATLGRLLGVGPITTSSRF